MDLLQRLKKGNDSSILALENMRRCQDMLECKEQIRFWKTRLNRLKTEHKRVVRLSSLQRSAASVWPSLSRKEKWRKEVVLAALQSPILPTPFQCGYWEIQSPVAIRNDRDIVLARLQRDDFKAWGGFRLPPELYHDKEVVLAALRRHPDIVLTFPSLLVDRMSHDVTTTGFFDDDYQVAMLRALLETQDGRQHFSLFVSDKIRGDSELMMEVWKKWILTSHDDKDCDDGAAETLPLDALFFAKTLSDDKRFALQLAALGEEQNTLPGNALLCFSERLRADKDVVAKFCHYNGGNLQHASDGLREDLRIVRLATLSNPFALRFSKLNARNRGRITSQKPLMVELFQRTESLATPWFRARLEDGTEAADFLWKMCSHKLQQDNQVFLAAARAGISLSITNLPPSLLASTSFPPPKATKSGKSKTNNRNNKVQSPPLEEGECRQFWMNAILGGKFYWLDLPEYLSIDNEFAVAVLVKDEELHRKQSNSSLKPSSALDLETIETMLFHCPDVAMDPRVILTLMRFHEDNGLLHTYLNELPSVIVSDKHLMLCACEEYPDVLEYLPSHLQEDRDIIERTVSAHPASLQYMTGRAQHLFPELVAKAIRNMPVFEHGVNDIWDIFDDIDEDLWMNREVALAWTSRGGSYLHDEFPEEYDTDQELFLHIAEHNWDDFMFASEELLCDKEFMMQAVAKNGCVLRDGKAGLSTDFDVALVAFAQTEEILDQYSWSTQGDDFIFLTRFAKRVREELGCHASFVELLKCLSSPSAQQGGNGLMLLQIGKETTHAFTKKIAEYMGVPVGKDLRMLRKASNNLARWGF